MSNNRSSQEEFELISRKFYELGIMVGEEGQVVTSPLLPENCPSIRGRAKWEWFCLIFAIGLFLYSHILGAIFALGAFLYQAVDTSRRRTLLQMEKLSRTNLVASTSLMAVRYVALYKELHSPKGKELDIAVGLMNSLQVMMASLFKDGLPSGCKCEEWSGLKETHLVSIKFSDLKNAADVSLNDKIPSASHFQFSRKKMAEILDEYQDSTLEVMFSRFYGYTEYEERLQAFRVLFIKLHESSATMWRPYTGISIVLEKFYYAE